MFGHQDNQPTAQSDQSTTTSTSQGAATASSVDQSYPDQQSIASDLDIGPSTDQNPQTSDEKAWQHPAKALEDTKDQKDDVISPAGGYPKVPDIKDTPFSSVPTLSSHTHSGGSLTDNQLTDATDEGLLEVKQKALDELFPLIDKLDQTSEEHFKTLMMIIQASDNHTLIEKAYQVAQTIDDEKARAQALLDIINEINYFTQQPEI
jgi:hypothetical protein